MEDKSVHDISCARGMHTLFRHFLSSLYGIADSTQCCGKPSRARASLNSWANFIVQGRYSRSWWGCDNDRLQLDVAMVLAKINPNVVATAI
jgi:hypothetical protein